MSSPRYEKLHELTAYLNLVPRVDDTDKKYEKNYLIELLVCILLQLKDTLNEKILILINWYLYY